MFKFGNDAKSGRFDRRELDSERKGCFRSDCTQAARRLADLVAWTPFCVPVQPIGDQNLSVQPIGNQNLLAALFEVGFLNCILPAAPSSHVIDDVASLKDLPPRQPGQAQEDKQPLTSQMRAVLSEGTKGTRYSWLKRRLSSSYA